jgi:hypothetical protein
VRGQAFALALTLIAASVLSWPLSALILTLVCGVLAFYLRGRYRGELLRARVSVVAHRERLDRIVDGDLQTLLVAGLTPSLLMLGFSLHPVDIGLARVTPLLVAIAAAGVYVSSVADWFIILPRISGMLGARPCRTDQERHPRYPQTWRETTRFWLIHRILAVLIFRFGLSYALTYTLHRYIALPFGTEVIGGAALGFVASYEKVIPSAGLQAGHPSMIVGHTVQHAETRRAPRKLRVLTRSIRVPLLTQAVATGKISPREWVYDIAVEGVQVVEAALREGAVPVDADGSIIYEREPRKIPLRDIGGVKPAKRPFQGCQDRCSGINWYCIENPRCFAPK